MTEPVPAKPDPICPECGHPLNCNGKRLVDVRAVYEQVRKTLREQPARERKYAVGDGWAPGTVCAARVTEAPPLERIVVAVDPRGAGEETGIIVAGRTTDGQFYILGDYSADCTPDKCVGGAIEVCRARGAHVIAWKANLVGDYMEALLERTLERLLHPREYHEWFEVERKPIHAHRDFLERCKPVGALYEQGRVHHVGALPELEDRMFTWMPLDRKPTGRIEALVCAITELSGP